MREQTEECKHTQRVSEVKVESVKQSVVQSSSQSGGGGIFTRSKDLGERHLVFTTFLTSAWRGGRRLRRDGGMEVEVGR